MKKRLFILLLCLLLIPSSLAANHIQVDYEIFDSSVLTTINSEEGNFEMKVPYDTKIIDSNVNYSLEDRILKVEPGKNIKLEYSTKSYVDKVGRERFFTLVHPVNNSKIILYLPEKGIISEDEIILPEADEIKTDGRRIFLVWDNFEEGQLVISYSLIEENDFLYWAIILLLILGLIGIYYYNNLKRKREIEKVKKSLKKTTQKKEEEITKNLYEEEKEIVRFLLKKKGNEAWTKDIMKELGISKVKLSRKLRSLEGKGLIQRIPHGSENRIKLIKKKTSAGF